MISSIRSAHQILKNCPMSYPAHDVAPPAGKNGGCSRAFCRALRSSRARRLLARGLFRLTNARLRSFCGGALGFGALRRFLGQPQCSQFRRFCVNCCSFLRDFCADHLVAALRMREVALRRAAGRLSFFVRIGHGEIFLLLNKRSPAPGRPPPSAHKNFTLA